MKALYAEFTARQGCEERVSELVAKLTADVRTEPGNVLFDPFTRTGAPRSYVVFEVYRDEEAFRAHLHSAHSQAFNQELADLIEGTTSTLEWLDPVV